MGLLSSTLPEHQGADVGPWLAALPDTPEAQFWRNKALWAACLALKEAPLVALLKAGARNARWDASRASRGDLAAPNTHLSLPLAAQLLLASPPIRAVEPTESRVLDLLGRWVEHDPCLLNTMTAAVAGSGAAIRRFTPDGLRRLTGMGVSFTGEHAWVWFTPFMPLDGGSRDARLIWESSLGTELEREALLRDRQAAVRTLFELGASPEQSWPQGGPLLHRLLRWGQNAGPAHLSDWFWLILHHGANPLARLSSGDTLLHSAFRGAEPGTLPMDVVDHLVSLRPGDLTTPGSDGHTPLELLEFKAQAGESQGKIWTLHAQPQGALSFSQAPAPVSEHTVATRLLLSRLRCRHQANRLDSIMDPPAPETGEPRGHRPRARL